MNNIIDQATQRTLSLAGNGIVLLLSVILLGCSQPPSSAGLNSPGNLVKAGGETLRGEILNPEEGLVVFRGIPFAAPPVGDRRWRPPASHTPRGGIQDATQFGPACPQRQGNPEFYRFVAKQVGADPEVIPPLENISEDCLYLNIWTRHVGSENKRPVMVWIYGGGNSNGYSQEPEYLGHNLASRDVIYVSLNYRLGALGYLAHKGLSGESERGVSGNYGILDQVAALEWVRDNIEAFGGDPDNVTVFGESAGAANTATLIASPLGKGLFHRAISQSGGYVVDVFYTLEEAEAMGGKIAQYLELEIAADPARTVSGLRALSWQAIVQGAAEADAGGYSNVNVDGWVLPDALSLRFERGVDRTVQLMIGANENENFPWVKSDADAADLAASLESNGAPYADEFEAILSENAEWTPRRQLDRFGSAQDFLCPSLFIADAMAANGNDVYFYYFTRVRPGADSLLAYHGAEISYVLDTAYPWLPADRVDRDLTDTLGQYWVNFAATGSPNGAGVPEWPRYTGESGQYQELGDEVKPGSDLETDLCNLFDRIRQNQIESFIDQKP